MIKSMHVIQRSDHRSVAEELDIKLTYLQAVKGYKVIQIFESKTNPQYNCSEQSFIIVYDTLTEHVIPDIDLKDIDIVKGFLDDSLKKAIEKWCADRNAVVFRYGAYAFAYMNRFNGDINCESYESIPKEDEDVAENKEEIKEPIERKKTKRFKIDKETIDILHKIKNYCEHKDHCWKCPLGYEAKDSSGEQIFRCKLAKGDPRYWDLEEE